MLAAQFRAVQERVDLCSCLVGLNVFLWEQVSFLLTPKVNLETQW